jgi:hypothetical protein
MRYNFHCTRTVRGAIRKARPRRSDYSVAIYDNLFDSFRSPTCSHREETLWPVTNLFITAFMMYLLFQCSEFPEFLVFVLEVLDSFSCGGCSSDHD